MPLIEKEPVVDNNREASFHALDKTLAQFKLGSPRRVKPLGDLFKTTRSPQVLWVARWVAKEGFGLTYAKPTWDNFCGRYWMFCEQAYSNVWEYPVIDTTGWFAQLRWKEAMADKTLASKAAYIRDTYTGFLHYVLEQVGRRGVDVFYPSTSFLALWRGWCTGSHESSDVRPPVRMFASTYFKQYVSQTLEPVLGIDKAAEFHGRWIARPDALVHDNVEWDGWGVGK